MQSKECSTGQLCGDKNFKTDLSSKILTLLNLEIKKRSKHNHMVLTSLQIKIWIKSMHLCPFGKSKFNLFKT